MATAKILYQVIGLMALINEPIVLEM